MSIYKELSYDADIDTIEGIQFCIMSGEEIERRSVAEILTTNTYSNNVPVINGLFDNRMGVVDNNVICKTCEQKYTFCPGHFGHIILAKPVFFIQFFDIVKKILKCVCFRCSKILIDDSNKEIQKILSRKYSRQKKFDQVYKLCSKIKIKRCGQENATGCGIRQPDKIIKDNIGKIYMEWKNLEDKDDDEEETTPAVNKEDDITKQTFWAEDIKRILERITDDDCELLGFSKVLGRPENMICTVFPVPPPTVRPSVRNDTGQRCEDDLTHKLCDIVKANNTLKSKLKTKTTDIRQIEHWTTLLQYHISTFIDNNIPSLAPAKQRTGRPLRSLVERLKSKEGRIRGNLMGNVRH